MIRRSVALLLLLLSFSAFAQIPTPEEFLGYGMGERFTPHHRILAYFEVLTRRSPLITMRQIGETYEHRPLVLATITSAKNHLALETIRRNAQALANGDGDVDALVRDGLASRREDPVDRRVKRLALTTHGQETITRLAETRREGLRRFVETLDADARGQLSRALAAIPSLTGRRARSWMT